MTAQLTLDRLNAMDRAAFTAALGGIFEYSPWIAEKAWEKAPFASLTELHAAMAAVILGGDLGTKRALIRAHPDLAGRAAGGGSLTAASREEQRGAGLLDLNDAEYDRFHRLNTAYRERFGFPFVIAVRRHAQASLFAAFEARLQNEPTVEIAAALEEICTIGRFRLEALLMSAEPPR
jgi:2-oxo-4-hydroxy-4-carboxy-5-ureidoimidazoline decarboxylase